MLMDLLAKARRIEAHLARQLDRAAKELVRPRERGPLEIAHAVVERVEAQIQPSGRGSRVFPFTHVAVSVLAASDAARARFDAVFTAMPSLQERIAERLASAGCGGTPPAVAIHYVTRVPKSWAEPEFDVRFARAAEAPEPLTPASQPAEGRIELTVLRGTADRRTYSFTANGIDIGRCREVRDGRHRLIRSNDVAFADGADAVNSSVSRQHAHISYDRTSAAFRLRDDGSAHGTAIVRAGKMVQVPRGSRGVRLESGDEIVLGDARLRVRVL